VEAMAKKSEKEGEITPGRGQNGKSVARELFLSSEMVYNGDDVSCYRNSLCDEGLLSYEQQIFYLR